MPREGRQHRQHVVSHAPGDDLGHTVDEWQTPEPLPHLLVARTRPARGVEKLDSAVAHDPSVPLCLGN